MRRIIFLTILFSCSTTRTTYEIADTPSKVVVQTIKEPRLSETERKPDVQSVRATVTDDYPEKTTSALYQVTSQVNVRDFPSQKDGKVVGRLFPGEVVVGHEIEGCWIRVYKNKYTSLNFLKKLK